MASKDDDTSVKLADFGLSRFFEDARAAATMCGTPTYLAPEMLSSEEYGASVDCWAIGVITYILLTGRTPFPTSPVPRLFHSILFRPIPYPDDLWVEVSADAKSFVQALLVRDLDERLTVAQALEHPWLRTQAPSPAQPAPQQRVTAMSAISSSSSAASSSPSLAAQQDDSGPDLSIATSMRRLQFARHARTGTVAASIENIGPPPPLPPDYDSGTEDVPSSIGDEEQRRILFPRIRRRLDKHRNKD
jgi:serine/threonine protein kinase